MECKVCFTFGWLGFTHEASVLSSKRVGSLEPVKLELWFCGGANGNIRHQGHVWASQSEIWEGQCKNGRTLHDKCVEDLRQRIWVHQKEERKKERRASYTSPSFYGPAIIRVKKLKWWNESEAQCPIIITTTLRKQPRFWHHHLTGALFTLCRNHIKPTILLYVVWWFS